MSYASTSLGVVGRIRSVPDLWRMRVGTADATAQATVATVDQMKNALRAHGYELIGRDVLDIGPGQQLRQMKAVSADNRVVGIDSDLVVQGFSPKQYARMFVANGALRTIKTLGRKALGADRALDQALSRRVGTDGFGRLDVRTMDAGAMGFADRSFDIVMSFSCFEHLEDPRAALREIRRVVRPGGWAWISIHNYTSHSGQHDVHVMAQNPPHEPFWPHLRPKYAPTVHPATYLNRLRLADWESLFAAALPGTTWHRELHLEVADAMPSLRAAGELADYTDDELLSINLVAQWRCPED